MLNPIKAVFTSSLVRNTDEFGLLLQLALDGKELAALRYDFQKLIEYMFHAADGVGIEQRGGRPRGLHRWLDPPRVETPC